MSYRRYTEVEKQFLKENINKYTYKELTSVFNRQFKTNKAWGSIAKFCKKLGLNKTYYGHQHNFSAEEKQFLKENIDRYTYPQLTQAFNSRFGTRLTQFSISDVCLKRMGIKRNKAWKFAKGRKDFVYSCPIGTESDSGKDIFIKVADNYREGVTPSKGSDPNWRRKQDIVWEQAHGREKPSDGVILFLDKNNRNFDPNNLYCTNRKINFMMGKNKWHSTNKELSLAAIKWCEMYYALKEGPTDG